MVALSTSQAEYVALSSVAQEAMWLQRLLRDLQVHFKEQIAIFEDYQGAIAIERNPVSHSRTKHIDIKYHYTRETVKMGTWI